MVDIPEGYVQIGMHEGKPLIAKVENGRIQFFEDWITVEEARQIFSDDEPLLGGDGVMANARMTELEVVAFFKEWQSRVGPFRVQRAKEWLAESGFHLETEPGDHVVLVNDAGQAQDPGVFFATLGVQTE